MNVIYRGNNSIVLFIIIKCLWKVYRGILNLLFYFRELKYLLLVFKLIEILVRLINVNIRSLVMVY